MNKLASGGSKGLLGAVLQAHSAERSTELSPALEQILPPGGGRSGADIANSVDTLSAEVARLREENGRLAIELATSNSKRQDANDEAAKLRRLVLEDAADPAKAFASRSSPVAYSAVSSSSGPCSTTHNVASPALPGPSWLRKELAGTVVETARASVVDAEQAAARVRRDAARSVGRSAMDAKRARADAEEMRMRANRFEREAMQARDTASKAVADLRATEAKAKQDLRALADQLYRVQSQRDKEERKAAELQRLADSQATRMNRLKVLCQSMASAASASSLGAGGEAGGEASEEEERGGGAGVSLASESQGGQASPTSAGLVKTSLASLFADASGELGLHTRPEGGSRANRQARQRQQARASDLPPLGEGSAVNGDAVAGAASLALASSIAASRFAPGRRNGRKKMAASFALGGNAAGGGAGSGEGDVRNSGHTSMKALGELARTTKLLLQAENEADGLRQQAEQAERSAERLRTELAEAREAADVAKLAELEQRAAREALERELTIVEQQLTLAEKAGFHVVAEGAQSEDAAEAARSAHSNGGAPKTVQDWQAMQEARLQNASAEMRANERSNKEEEAKRAEVLQQKMLDEGRAKLN